MCICLCLAALGSIGCSIPQAPAENLSWDTHFVLPLGVRTYGLGELADTPEEIRAAGSGIGIDSVTGLLYFSTWTDINVPLRDSLMMGGINAPVLKQSGEDTVSATVNFPAQEHRLTVGLIHSGTARLIITTTTSTPETVRVMIREIEVDQFGTPLTLTAVTNTSQPDTVTVDLEGDSLRLANTMPQQLSVRIVGSENRQYNGSLTISPLQFNYYRGVVTNLTIEGVNGSTAVDPLPEGWEGVHPATVDAYVHIEGGMTATADVVVQMQTRRNNAVVGNASTTVNNVFLGNDTTLAIHGLEELISTYPDFASAVSTVTFDGPVESHVADSLQMDVELRAPLEFTMDPLHAPGEVRKVDTGDIADVTGGAITLRVWNRLPIGGMAYLLASADSGRIADDSLPVDTLGRISLPVPPLSNGRPIAEAYDSTMIVIDDVELALFEEAKFFTRTDIRLQGSAGDTLRAYGADYIKVQAIAEVDYRIDTNDENDDEGGN